MIRSFPIPDAPINQRRTAPGNLIADRFNIIGTDSVSVHVYVPIQDGWKDGFTTTTYMEEDEIPAGIIIEHWRYDRHRQTRYAEFGLLNNKQPEQAQAAIDAAFPGYRESQAIPGAGHQARVENWQRCDPGFRAIGAENACPCCGTWKYRSRSVPCKTCREHGLIAAVAA
jgi:hypothetical protein